jgi:hypothetical protein
MIFFIVSFVATIGTILEALPILLEALSALAMPAT